MAHALVDDNVVKKRPKYGGVAPRSQSIGPYFAPGYAPVYTTTDNHYYHNLKRTATTTTTTTRRWAFCDWFLILLLVGFLLWIMILVTLNYNNDHVHVTSKNDNDDAETLFLEGGIRTDPMKCKVGEQWDVKLQMCAPVIHWPVAVNNAMMDTSVNACQDFYQHTCGSWIKDHENENYAFSYVHKKNQHTVRDIIKDPNSGPVYTFYDSCMNALVEKRIHALEETKLERKHVLEKILGGIRHVTDLPSAFGRLARSGFTSPLTISIEQHPRRKIMVPLVHWDGFDVNQITHEQISAVFTEAKGFIPYHADEFARRAMRVIDGLAAHRPGKGIDEIHSYVEYVKSEQFKEDMVTFNELPSWLGYKTHSSGWNTYLERVDGHGLRFKPDHPTWFLDADYIQWLLTIGLSQFTMDEWRAYLTFCILYNTHDYAPELPEDVYFRKHIFLSHVHPEKRHPHRFKKRDSSVTSDSCVRITQYMIPGLVASEFLKRQFPNGEHTREKLTKLVNRMKDTFSNMIEQTHWMDAQTQTVTIEKIRSIVPRVVHPNNWSVEPFAPRLDKDRWLHNINMVREYRVERNMANWHEDGYYERDVVAVFGAPLATVNAFYSPLSNTVSF